MFKDQRTLGLFLVLTATVLIIVCCTRCTSIPVTPPRDTKAEIEKLVGESACSTYSWKNRGKAPLDYYVRLAETFHKEECMNEPVIAQGLASKDALTQYEVAASREATYAFLTGLGPRESSGKWCTGRDSSADNVASESAEAGVFQFSYDSRGAHPRLLQLYAEYKPKTGEISCVSKDWGTGEGVPFQRLSKTNPEFAIRYGAVLIRTRKNHFGPIIRGEVEYRKECFELFKSVKGLGCP